MSVGYTTGPIVHCSLEWAVYGHIISESASAAVSLDHG